MLGLVPVTIIIPAFNQLEYCRSCIQSIQANTRLPHRLVLIDNGSTDGVSEYFDSVPGATVIHAPKNLGFAGGVNLGLAVAEGHVIVLNSDTLLPPGWLGHLEVTLDKASGYGAIGPVTNCASGDQQIDGLTLGGEGEVAAYSRERWQEFGSSVRETNRLVGFCLVLRDKVWQQIGEFDTRFGIGNFEDDDYCTRIRRAGYKLGVAEGCFVYHFGGRTFEGMGMQGESYHRLLDENRRKYMEKWDVFLPEPGRANSRRSEEVRREAEQALARGEVSAALSLYREAVTADPGMPDNFFGLGEALIRAGQLKLGLEAYIAGLKLAPGHKSAASRATELASTLGLDDVLRRIGEITR